MKLTNKIKNYNFWVALSMSFLLLLNTVARAFDIEIDNDLYNDIVTAVLGVATVLGFIQKDPTSASKSDEADKVDISQHKIETGNTTPPQADSKTLQSTDQNAPTSDSSNTPNQSKKLD